MATQKISIAAFQELLADCADSIAARNWSTAISKYAQAEAVNMGLDLVVTHAETSTTRRASLEKLKYAIDAAKDEASALTDDQRFGIMSTGFGYNP
jgi:aspartate aminotransferase-like enzyme